MKYLAIALALFAFTGCATLGGGQTPPEGCEDSLIYAKIGNVKEVDLLLKLGNVQALKKKVYTKRQVLSVFDELETLIKDGQITYKEIALKVLSYVKWVNDNAGIEILIVSEYIMDFEDTGIQLSECDRALLLGHLEKQRIWTNMVAQ